MKHVQFSDYSGWQSPSGWWHSPDEDTPAVIYHRDAIAGTGATRPAGTRMWLRNGNKHRMTGPAVEYPEDSGKENEYWIRGERVSYKEWIESGGDPAVGKELVLEL